MAHKERLVILIAVLILAAGFAYWYFVLRGAAPAAPAAPEMPIGALEEPASLGAHIAEEAQNPIKGDLPTVAPNINPIKGLYKNPFE